MQSRMWGAGSGSRSRLNTREQSSLLNESGTTSLSQAQQGLAAIDQLQAEREAERERERVEQLRQSVQNAADAANNWMESMQELLQQTDAAYSDGQQRSAKQIADDQAQLTAKMEELSAVKAGLEQYKDYYDADQYAGMMDGFDNMSQSWQWIQSGMNAYDTDWEEYQKLLADVSDVDWGEDVVIADPYSFYRAQASGQEGLQDLYYEDYLHSFNSAAYGKRMDTLSVKDLQDDITAFEKTIDDLETKKSNEVSELYLSYGGYIPDSEFDDILNIENKYDPLIKSAEQDLKDAQNTLKEKQEWDEQKNAQEARKQFVDYWIGIERRKPSSLDIERATKWDKINQANKSVDGFWGWLVETVTGKSLSIAQPNVDQQDQDRYAAIIARSANGSEKKEQDFDSMSESQREEYVFSPSSDYSQIVLQQLQDEELSVYDKAGLIVESGYTARQAERLLKILENKIQPQEMAGIKKAISEKRTYDQLMTAVSAIASEHPVWSSIASVPMKLTSAPQAFEEDAAGYIAQKIAGKNYVGGINPYVGGNAMQGAAQTIRQTVGGNMENEVARFGYDVGMGIADTVTTIGVSALTGVPDLSLIITGTQAASDMIRECKERGLSDDHAMATGMLAGITEVALDKLSLNNLKSVQSFMSQPGKTVAKTIGKVLTQMGIQGMEEGVTDIANTISDVVVNGDQSSLAQNVARYQENGLTEKEAVKEALIDLAVQTGRSTLAGWISGGILAGGAAIGARISGYDADAHLDAETRATLQDTALDAADIQQQTAWLNQELAQQYRQAELQQAAPALQYMAGKYPLATAQAFVEGYDGGLPVDMYQRGFDEVYTLAQQGVDADTVMNQSSTYGGMLTTQQKQLAYEAGAAKRNSLPNSGDGDRLSGENGNSGANDFGNGAENNQEVRIKLTPATNEIKTLLENAGLHQEKIDEIVNLPKGQKPVVTSYLSQEYIDSHLQDFKERGVVKILASEPKGTIGGRSGIFVLSEVQLLKIIEEANGDISRIEEILGFDSGYLGSNPVVVKFDSPQGLRMPDGNEMGALPDYWIPGGYTSGGIAEAVIDAAPEGTYSYYYLK